MYPGDRSPIAIGVEALLKQHPQDLTAQQLGKIVAGLVGLHSAAFAQGDAENARNFVAAIDAALQELVRRARDLDPPESRTS